MTLYEVFTPDPLWVALAIAGFGSLATGWLGRSRLRPGVSRRLVIGGLSLVGVVLVYSV
jgi:hypothetical protein